MAYAVAFTAKAKKDLRGMDHQVIRRVQAAVQSLASNPRGPGSKELTGHPGLSRVRVGDVRILYEIHDDVLVVKVVKVAGRGEVYRNLDRL